MTSVTAAPGRLQDRVAIITGSSSGMGRAIAIAYAKEGAKVVCSDLQPHGKFGTGDDSSEATHNIISASGGTAFFTKADVEVVEEIELLISQTVKKYGRLDIMINNAGRCMELEIATATSIGEPIHLTPVSVYDKTMGINVRGTFMCCKYSIAQMMKQDPLPSGERGWIINIASSAGVIAFPGCPAYCASKGAVVSLTRQIALDYGKHKIHANAILPGGIKTPLLDPIMNQPTMGAMIANHPWEALGEPKHIAGAAVFLASEDAGYITGAIIPVDGGLIVH